MRGNGPVAAIGRTWDDDENEAYYVSRMHTENWLEDEIVSEGESVATANRSMTLHWHDMENDVKDKDQGPRKSYMKRGRTVD